MSKNLKLFKRRLGSMKGVHANKQAACANVLW